MNNSTRREDLVPGPGAHGGDGRAVAAALGFRGDQLLDLSATMNPLAPDVASLAARHLDEIRHYPDDRRATALLAGAIGVSPEQLVLTNGGSEAIALVAGELGEAEVVEPEFSLWRRHLRTVSPDAARVRSNPNNPSGQLASAEERAGAWDEAFYPLSTGSWTRGDAAHGAYVLGSLTKLFSCPGLRLGYVIAPDELTAHDLRERQVQWSVNGLALALCAELVELARLSEWSKELRSLGDGLQGLLNRAGLDVERADAPWMLVHDAPWLRPALAVGGVLVRDCSSFGMPGTQRIAVPGPIGLERVEQALEKMAARGSITPC